MKFLPAFLLLLATSLLCRGGELSTQVLREMNHARMAPQEYATLLAERMEGRETSAVAEAIRFLQKANALPPFLSSEGLSASAMQHVAEQGASGGVGHGNAFGRMSQYGRREGCAGENIAYGRDDARGFVMRLIVDEGTRGRGHRANIFSRSYRVVGVACGGHARYGGMCVMDFAGSFTERGGSTLARLSERGSLNF